MSLKSPFIWSTYLDKSGVRLDHGRANNTLPRNRVVNDGCLWRFDYGQGWEKTNLVQLARLATGNGHIVRTFRVEKR
jgi:hypothetical protein